MVESYRLTVRSKDTEPSPVFTVPEINSFRTTIEAINSTGVLFAVRDGVTHVSVYPIGGTIKEWRDAGKTSIWTQALYSVCTKVK